MNCLDKSERIMNRITDVAKYGIFLFFWPVAVLPKLLQLPAVMFFLLVSIWADRKELEQRTKDSFLIFQGLFLIISAISTIGSIAFDDHEANRMLAAFNTWSIDAMAALYYLYYSKVNIDKSKLKRICIINVAIMVVFCFTYKVIGYDNLPTVLGRHFGEVDYLDSGVDARFLGLLDYQNLVVFSIFIFMPLAFMGADHIQSAVISLAILAFSMFVVFETHSRIGGVAYVAVIMIVIYFVILRKFRKHKKMINISIISLAIAAGIVFKSFWIRIYDLLNGIRSGSSALRVKLYLESINKMLNESPIIGMGVRDNFGKLSAPMGSHSTYIGAFYKAGILGGIFFIVSIIILVINLMKKSNNNISDMFIKAFALGLVIVMIAEDVDGTAWVACLTFSLFALANNRQTEE